MIRKIIKINEEKCNGCGACAAACHEGAIGMVGGISLENHTHSGVHGETSKPH